MSNLSKLPNWLTRYMPWLKPSGLDISFANLAYWYKNNSDTRRWENFEKKSDLFEKEYNALLDEMRKTPGIAAWLTQNVTWDSGQVIFTRTKLEDFLKTFNVNHDPALVDMIFPPTA